MKTFLASLVAFTLSACGGGGDAAQTHTAAVVESPGLIDALASPLPDDPTPPKSTFVCPLTQHVMPAGFHGALVCKCGTSQAIPQGQNGVFLTFEAVIYDTDGFFNHGAPDRFTMPAGFTVAQFQTRQIWHWGTTVDGSMVNAGGGRQTVIKKNYPVDGGFHMGAGIHNQMAVDFTTTDYGAQSFKIPAQAGDFWQVEAYQTNAHGGDVNVLGSTSTCFAVEAWY